MRAVFTIKIPIISVDADSQQRKVFMTRLQFVSKIAELGWETSELSQLNDGEKLERYKQIASDVFTDTIMPELAAEEKSELVFVGKIQAYQTKLYVTMPTINQATIRLLHENLGNLLRASEMAVKMIVSVGFQIVDNEILVFEKAHDNVIVHGRHIAKPWKETRKIAKKESFTGYTAVLLTILSLTGLVVIPQTNTVIHGTLERFSTAMITTFVISLLSILHTFWNIRRTLPVRWNVGESKHIDT